MYMYISLFLTHSNPHRRPWPGTGGEYRTGRVGGGARGGGCWGKRRRQAPWLSASSARTLRHASSPGKRLCLSTWHTERSLLVISKQTFSNLIETKFIKPSASSARILSLASSPGASFLRAGPNRLFQFLWFALELARIRRHEVQIKGLE